MDGSGKEGKEAEGNRKSNAQAFVDMVGMAHQICI